VEVAIYLIQQGADINFKDRFGSTPRSEAANHNLSGRAGSQPSLPSCAFLPLNPCVIPPADVIPEALGRSRIGSPSPERTGLSKGRERAASSGSATSTSATLAVNSNGKALPRLSVTTELPIVVPAATPTPTLLDGKGAKGSPAATAAAAAAAAATSVNGKAAL
jgi:hypothetical protein